MPFPKTIGLLSTVVTLHLKCNDVLTHLLPDVVGTRRTRATAIPYSANSRRMARLAFPVEPLPVLLQRSPIAATSSACTENSPPLQAFRCGASIRLTERHAVRCCSWFGCRRTNPISTSRVEHREIQTFRDPIAAPRRVAYDTETRVQILGETPPPKRPFDTEYQETQSVFRCEDGRARENGPLASTSGRAYRCAPSPRGGGQWRPCLPVTENAKRGASVTAWCPGRRRPTPNSRSLGPGQLPCWGSVVSATRENPVTESTAFSTSMP